MLLYQVVSDTGLTPGEVLTLPPTEQAFLFAARSEVNQRENERNRNRNRTR